MAKSSPESPSHHSVYVKVALTALGVAATAVVGVILAVRIVAVESERDLQNWQVRLGIVVDSRFAAVNGWIERQYAELTGLADNTSLQIYMTELSLADGDRGEVTDEPAQAAYLRNLLVVTAERGGFAAPAIGPDVAANVERTGVAGLGLVDMAGRVIVATPHMPPLEGRLGDFVRNAPRGERALLDIASGVSGKPRMAFLAPIFAVQADAAASAQIGMVVGVKEVGPELFDALRQPGEVQETAETVILRTTAASIEYLSPLLDGSGPLERRMARDTAGLAATFAVESPGGVATGE